MSTNHLCHDENARLFSRNYGREEKEKEGSNFRESQGVLRQETLLMIIDRKQEANGKEGKKEGKEK